LRGETIQLAAVGYHGAWLSMLSVRISLQFVSLLIGLVSSMGISAFSQAAPASSHAAVFSLITDREPVISLDGLWRFHPGDDPRWASPDLDDSAWPLLRSDTPWTEQGYPNLDGFAWYRFTVEPPSPALPLAIVLPSILTDYELFENGKKIGGFGHMPPHGTLRFNQTALYQLAPAQPGAPLQMAIRVWHHPTFAAYLGGGPRYGGALLGLNTILERQFRSLDAERSTLVVSFYVIGVLNAVISITVFGLYFYRRSEREYLWFALVLLASALQSALAVSNFFLHFPVGLGDILAEVIGALGVAASLLFFSRVLNASRTFLWRGVLLIALLDPLNVLLYLFRVTSPATSTSLRVLFDLPIMAYIIVLLFRRALAGSRDARLLFVPTVLLYGTGILGGLLLFLFQLGWRWQVLASVNQWNVFENPFPVPLQVFVQLIFIVALLAFLIRRFASSRAQEERYSTDLEAARTLQQVLIPETLPSIPGLDISTAYHPAQEVGGDFYQILPLPVTTTDAPHDTLIVIGDVAGKGLPAAMTVSMLVGALRSIIETTRSPAETLAGLNRRLVGRGSGFTTCLAIRLSSSGNLVLANAGHLAPYRNGQEIVTPPALPLGLDPSAVFAEETYQLADGDRLTLLTDGVPEASRHKELFGFERTARISAEPAATIAEAALHFGQADDITVLSIVLDHESRNQVPVAG
jgi:sigma-B regulation protein RsbU (phosphoserine phosphatase)